MSEPLPAPRSERVTEIDVPGGPIQLSPQIIRKYCVSGRADLLSDQECFYAIARCKAYRLNPFVGEIQIIKYSRDDPAAFIIPKESFLKRAQRHPAYQGFKAGTAVMREGDGDLKVHYLEGALVPTGWSLIGGWAEVHRSDLRFPVRVEVALNEYAQRTREGLMNKFWRDKPATMVRKVAVVQALREAFPEEFQGLFERDEMADIPDTIPVTVTPVVDAPVRGAAPVIEVGKPGTAPALTESPTSDAKEVRSRRRRQAVNPALFNGKSELLTAGVLGSTLDKIAVEMESSPVVREAVLAFMRDLGISNLHVTYLREDEAQDLLKMLNAATTENSDCDLIDCPDRPGDKMDPTKCASHCASSDLCAELAEWTIMHGEGESPPEEESLTNLF